MYLIDTEGIQHKLEDDLFVFQSQTEVTISSKQSVPYDFTPHSHPTKLEGKAKARGWLWFPALPRGIYPHRFICNFTVFAPGYTSGMGEDHETLEVAFDFKFTQLLPDARTFVTLEIEDV
jgi:hypothetical protein